MTAIIQSPNGAQVFLDGMPGSHELAKEPGDSIFSTWALTNAGDQAGFARITLSIPAINYLESDIPLEVPVGGRTLPGLFTNIPFALNLVHSSALRVEETDASGTVLGQVGADHFFTVTTISPAVGPVLGIVGDPDIQ